MSDDLGIKIEGRCSRCSGCKDCNFAAHELSRIDQYQYSVIRNNLRLDPVNDVFTTTYPYEQEPTVLEDNRSQAIALMQKTEKRLSRNPTHAKEYCEQFQDFIDRGVLSEITDEEMDEHKGPVFYVSHHEVLKPEST